MRRAGPVAVVLLLGFAAASVVSVHVAGSQGQSAVVFLGVLAHFVLDALRVRARLRGLPVSEWLPHALRPPAWVDRRLYVLLIVAPIFVRSLLHFRIGWLGLAFALELLALELLGRRRTRT